MKLIEELLKDHRYIFGVDPHTVCHCCRVSAALIALVVPDQD
jgi:hypothetical protein